MSQWVILRLYNKETDNIAKSYYEHLLFYLKLKTLSVFVFYDKFIFKYLKTLF